MTPPTSTHAAVTASAPGRVCLAGESLDWMTGGESITAAIPLRTQVTIRTTARGEPGVVELHAGAPFHRARTVAVDKLGVFNRDELDHLQATAHVLSARYGARLDNTAIESSTALPVAAGVSSSASVTVAASAALLYLADRSIPAPDTVCESAYRAESTELGTGAGWMDFMACTYGGVRRIRSGPSPTSVKLADSLGVPMVLIDTLQRHSTGRVLASKRDRLRAGDPGMREYADRAPGLVADIDTLLRSPTPDYVEVGEVINKAHNLLRDRVHSSTELIEACVARCLDAGAFGAKLSGSGHGGCLFALVPWGAVDRVRAALAALPVHVMVFTSGDALGVAFTPTNNNDEGN
ncbi:mevalonate kinase family protein [Nocardia takedensis]